jgi:hypothetical protein
MGGHLGFFGHDLTCLGELLHFCKGLLFFLCVVSRILAVRYGKVLNYGNAPVIKGKDLPQKKLQGSYSYELNHMKILLFVLRCPLIVTMPNDGQVSTYAMLLLRSLEA